MNLSTVDTPGPVTADRLARAALAFLVEPGNRELGLMLRREGADRTLDLMLSGAPISSKLAGAVAARFAQLRMPASIESARELGFETLDEATRLGARLITPEDREWPAQFADLALISRAGGDPRWRDTDPPICVWARGRPALRTALSRSVSIVGARACTNYGIHITRELAYGMAGRDWTVVSGGAFGIDYTAHRATIAAGGLTVAVLACGIDRPYPTSHGVLFDQIAEDGLLITEWPPGATAHRMRFLTRNRVIAASTRGTVMVEAGSRSGARNTLSHAMRLGRSAMVVPGPVTSAASVGCHAELRRPGTTLVTSVEEVIEEVGQVGELAPLPQAPVTAVDQLDPVSVRLLDAVLPRKARTPEEIAAVAGLSGREARSGLPVLEAAGFVAVTESGGYRLVPRPVGNGRVVEG